MDKKLQTKEKDFVLDVGDVDRTSWRLEVEATLFLE